jgi:hypothetical protein
VIAAHVYPAACVIRVMNTLLLGLLHTTQLVPWLSGRLPDPKNDSIGTGALALKNDPSNLFANNTWHFVINTVNATVSGTNRYVINAGTAPCLLTLERWTANPVDGL